MKKMLLTLATGLFATGLAFAQIPDGSVAPDFTSSDINGNSIELYADFLDQGKPVIMDVSATWCGPCWSYHNSHKMKDLYNIYGGNGSDEVGVLFVEGDASTGLNELNGISGSTTGDWVTGTPYPILDDAAIATLYQISYFPTIFGICPNQTDSAGNTVHKVFEAGQSVDLANWITTNCGVSLAGTVDNASITEGNFETVCLAGGDATPSVSITNHGSNDLTSLTVELFEAGAATPIDVQNWTGTLTSMTSATVTFSTITGLTASQDYTVVASQPNGTTDAYPAMNTSDFTIEVASFTSTDSVNVKIVTDNYPGETTWRLVDGAGAILASDGPYAGNGTSAGGADAMKEFNYPVAIPAGVDCYELIVDDTYGDGLSVSSITSGYWVNDGTTDVIASGANPNFGSSVTEFFGADGVASVETLNANFNIYPNPVNNVANIDFTLAETAVVNVAIVNVLGETVRSNAYNLVAGNHQIDFDVTDVTAGVYFIQLDVNGQTTAQKITVTK